MWVLSLGWEDPLEEGKVTHSSILAWRILWTEKPGRLPSLDFSGKNSGVGCHFLLQGIFSTQEQISISCIDRHIFYHPDTWGALRFYCIYIII